MFDYSDNICNDDFIFDAWGLKLPAMCMIVAQGRICLMNMQTSTSTDEVRTFERAAKLMYGPCVAVSRRGPRGEPSPLVVAGFCIRLKI